ncbi:MAG: tripartite tricarboxylate transporter permease [Nanoarchaeota archaeon]
MPWDLILAIIVGIVIGTFTGITPGIHINTVTALLVANLGVFSNIQATSLIMFVVSLAITHTILDFIPSILTGATDAESFLSVLPGHEMLKQGKGKEAILMVLIGVITSIPLIILITPLFTKFIPPIYEKIIPLIPFLLIFISSYTILREDKIWTALIVFLSTGILGFTALNSPVKDPLLPLLGGLFGGSSILISISQKIKIPKQDPLKIKGIISIKKDYFKSIIGSLISSPLCSFLPAIGSGHAATISSEIVPQTRKGFLIMFGTINILVMSLSFATLYALNKTRTGAAAAIKNIIEEISTKDLWNIIFVIIITIIIASILSIIVTNTFLKLMEKLNYRIVSICMLAILSLAVIILSNWLGFLVFITSTAWGIFAILSNVRRINMMGVLLLPTIILYLTNNL